MAIDAKQTVPIVDKAIDEAIQLLASQINMSLLAKNRLQNLANDVHAYFI